LTAKQLKGAFAPDASSYVTLTDGAGNLATAGGGITIGTSTITGGATTQVLFNLGGVVSSDAGFTYAGSSGAVTTGGLLRTSSAGAAATPSLSIGNTTTGLYSVSTTGLGISINGVDKFNYNVSNANSWTATGADIITTQSSRAATFIVSSGVNSYQWTNGSGFGASASGVWNFRNNGNTQSFNLATTAASGPIQFVDAGSFSANTTVATVLGSVGPAGAHTTVQKWLTIVDSGGTTGYIPIF
jgi:hypothetical protein